MSVLYTVTAPCPVCDTANQAEWAASVNADRRPDLRAAILDTSFQAQDCAKCGTPLRLPSHMTYLDTARGQWILVEDPSRLADWATQEAEATALFGETYGPSAPPVARSLGDGLQPRLVYGWAALREKLVCRDLGLDDVTLELLKFAMLHAGEGPAIGSGETMRLVGATGADLLLALVDADADTTLGTAEVPRDAYDAIAATPEDWAALRARFDAAAFVDAQRLTMPGG